MLTTIAIVMLTKVKGKNKDPLTILSNKFVQIPVKIAYLMSKFTATKIVPIASKKGMGFVHRI